MADLNLQLVLRFIDQATRPARHAMRQLDQTGQAMERAGRERAAAARAEFSGAALKAGAFGAAVYGVVRPAIEMETRMAEISKVVDFDPAGLKALQKGIFDLNTSGGIPMTADGLADIIYAAGQAGLVDKALPDDEQRRQLLAFAADAARMGVAFDISAERAGQAMTGWRKKMELSQQEALDLADAVNHLSNNMNAQAADVVDVIDRQGALSMAAGLTATEVAALSAAFVQAAPSPEIAATAMKNFTGALTAGEAMTARQSKVMNQLGFDAEKLALRMQEDAKGAILDVMQALSQLPEEKRASAVRQLFGEESAGAIAPLLQNLDALAEAFELVANRENYAGSMMDEFLRMAGTTEAKITALKNNLDKLRTNTGGSILPEFKAFIEWLIPALDGIAEWVGENGGIVKAVIGGTGALVSLNLVKIAMKWLFAGWLIGAGRVLQVMSALAGVSALAAGAWGVAALAIIAAGWLIYRNWDRILEWLRAKIRQIGDWTEEMVDRIAAKLAGIVPDWMKDAWDWAANQSSAPYDPRSEGPLGIDLADPRNMRAGGFAPVRKLSPALAGGQTTINNRTDVNVGGIVINQRAGETTDELARRTADYVREMNRNDGALHDGGSYVD